MSWVTKMIVIKSKEEIDIMRVPCRMTGELLNDLNDFIKPGISTLDVDTFCAEYIAAHGGKLDYIHGEETLRKLSRASDTVGFILPAIEKKTLFPCILSNGVLPRKTFSMGEALDKRYYLEARRIE